MRGGLWPPIVFNNLSQVTVTSLFGSMYLSRMVAKQFLRLFPLAVVLLLSTYGFGPKSVPTPMDSDWHEFKGTWTAVGSRHTLRLGNGRQTSIANFQGTLLLAGPERPGVGFRNEAVVLDDSVTGMVGRAVWTDEHGDQAWSELRGEDDGTGNKIVGNFVGGTGRYSGVTGTYEFSWRFLLEDEDGNVQGESVGLKGRVRVGSPGGSNAEATAKS